MKTESEAQLLRIFVGESDRWEGRPLYEAIVRAARDHGLAGATALRGIEGFGASNRIHTVKILRLSEDLPVVIEVVDRADRIASFLPTLDQMVTEGLVTLEKITAFVYRSEVAAQPVESDELQLESPEFSPEPGVSGGAAAMTEHARGVIEAARQSAAKCRRLSADSVDVLLALLHDEEGLADRVLAAAGIELEAVENSLDESVSRDEPSASFLAVLEQKSIAEAKWLNDQYAGTEHLLMALCETRPSTATDLLMRLGAQPRDICKEVINLLGHGDDWQRWLADHPDM